LADKLLVCSARIALVELEKAASWIVIVIIAREFIISGFRLIAAEHQIVIAASMWGKFKTTFQMAAIILLILSCAWTLTIGTVNVIYVLGQVVLYVALVLTIISLIDYLMKNRAVLSEQD
ncbi:MAG: CDP-diacylglycerol--glycerol-3-phosphate 3-phosphatidyltransferase, partial [Clostridiales bacterium]|nr:CDP-diacylglycerol--glycerol-3-phosphate 3-phosphatidyltransferase [Clostridiales bacterium]